METLEKQKPVYVQVSEGEARLNCPLNDLAGKVIDEFKKGNKKVSLDFFSEIEKENPIVASKIASLYSTDWLTYHPSLKCKPIEGFRKYLDSKGYEINWSSNCGGAICLTLVE